MKFRSLKTKILFWFGGATFLLLAGFNIAVYNFLEENTKLSIQNKLYNKAVFINKQILSNVNIQTLLKDKELESVDVAIIKEGKIIFKKGETNFFPFKKFINSKESFFVFNRDDDLDGLYVLKIYNPFEGAILFYEKSINDQIDNNLQQIEEILFVLEPILFFILMFMVSKLIDKILKSINKITQTANNIYVTDLSKQIPRPKYDDEIKDLVDSFNQMLNRLKKGVDTLEQFNSDVSHELKTPLTVIKGEIEITLNKDRDKDYYVNSLKTIEKETSNIQEIVDNLLLLTKYTKENVKQTFQKVSLDSVLINTVEKYKNALKEKNIKLYINRIDPITVKANPTLINTIFSNIIDNAVKYSPKNKKIFVSLYKKDKIYFFVKDEGIGIKKDQIEKITRRFYRTDASRNKKIKGFGLGLSIVKNSLELHNGQIEIFSKENVGTTVKVIL